MILLSGKIATNRRHRQSRCWYLRRNNRNWQLQSWLVGTSSIRHNVYWLRAHWRCDFLILVATLDNISIVKRKTNISVEHCFVQRTQQKGRVILHLWPQVILRDIIAFHGRSWQARIGRRFIMNLNNNQNANCCIFFSSLVNSHLPIDTVRIIYNLMWFWRTNFKWKKIKWVKSQFQRIHKYIPTKVAGNRKWKEKTKNTWQALNHWIFLWICLCWHVKNDSKNFRIFFASEGNRDENIVFAWIKTKIDSQTQPYSHFVCLVPM